MDIHVNDIVKAMALEGKPVSQIEAATGLKKNQIIGRMHRMGITLKAARRSLDTGQPFPLIKPPRKPYLSKPKPTPSSEVYGPTKLRERTPIKKVIPRVKAPIHREVSGKPVTLLELTRDHCRWMIDDTHFCGNLTKLLKNDRISSYCPGHHRIVYRPPQKGNPK